MTRQRLQPSSYEVPARIVVRGGRACKLLRPQFVKRVERISVDARRGNNGNDGLSPAHAARTMDEVLARLPRVINHLSSSISSFSGSFERHLTHPRV